MAIDANVSSAAARAYSGDYDVPELRGEGPTGLPQLSRGADRRRLSGPLVSILINNYNYARFVGAAIDSALEQTYHNVQVIVVDDGSTDGSREVIASYGDRVTAILKENGGQGSAFNAGIAASRGDILCFLDADDFFYADKVSHVVEAFRQRGLNSRPMLVHHLLTRTNRKGEGLEGRTMGEVHESPLNRYSFAQRHRFVWFETGPTTTISINRALARLLFPIPERGVRISGDDFVACGASLIGEVYSIGKKLGGYRMHGHNNWHRTAQKKSPEFVETLQSYLNQKLVENGKSPVISFDDSIYAWSRLIDDRRWAKLSWHMLRVAVKDHDKYTLLFMYHRAVEIGMMFMAELRRKRDDLLRHFARRQSDP